MGLVVNLSAIGGIFAVGIAFILFLPAVHYIAYVSDAYNNLPTGFLIMRDQMYEILLAMGVIIGLGVAALYVFNNAGRTRV